MKVNRRILIVVASGASLLFSGLLFHQFVLMQIILPLATAVWLLLRLFVLSIDQTVYWWGLIVAAIGYGLVRLTQRLSAGSPDPLLRSYRQSDRASSWRGSILRGLGERGETRSFRERLMWLFTAVCAQERPELANYQIREAFIRRQIPLPESIHSFLYSEDSHRASGTSTLKHPMKAFHERALLLRDSLWEWHRRKNGSYSAEYYRHVDEVVRNMEARMEMCDEAEV
ncbi:MAG TPA: hypothetical protein VMW69_06915 [Spirochaetia bacterium]|nr:hypothetical protein [Spirochaetia bacterium]